MKKIFTLVCAVLFVATVADGQSCPTPFKIVIIGSSTSAGTGVSVSDSAYVNRYRKFLIDSVNPGCTVVNLAIGGATTYKMQPTGYTPPANRSSFPADTARNITKAISLAPDGIIINYPSNDASSNFTLQEQKDNFLRVMAKADSAGIPVWITTTQPRDFTDTPRLNRQMQMRDWITNTYGPLHHIDFWTTIATSTGTITPAYNSGDGVHLNNAGHRILFDRVKARNIHVALCSSPSTVAYVPSNDIITIYPNPVVSTLNILVEKPAQPISCKVFDLSGREVSVQTSYDGALLRVAGFEKLAPGSYLVEIKNGSDRRTKLVTKAL